MEKTATIIVFEEDSYNSMFRVMFADVLSLPDVYLVVEKDHPKGILYRYLPSRKFRKLTCGLSQLPYFLYYNLPRKVKELSKSYDKINILFHNASLRKPKYPLSVFEYIKRYSVTLNLIYFDSREKGYTCSYANELCENAVFDRVMTFDPDDAERYGMELCSTPYSKITVDKVEENYRLYFCCSNSDRIYQLYLVWLSARKRNVAVKYDLLACQAFKPFFENDPSICFNEEYIEYPQLLRKMQESSCILDITKPEQAGFTLRPYEAVVYNKKLLTNNKRIFEFRFYDDRYMRYFEAVEDIDWNWINETINVDYGYNEEFSPQILLRKLSEPH